MVLRTLRTAHFIFHQREREENREFHREEIILSLHIVQWDKLMINRIIGTCLSLILKKEGRNLKLSLGIGIGLTTGN